MSHLRGPHVHLLIFAFYCLLAPLAVVTGWIYSVAFVGFLSIWALAEARLGTYKAAVVAAKQDEDADVQDVLDAVEAK